jgi:putative membrane protein
MDYNARTVERSTRRPADSTVADAQRTLCEQENIHMRLVLRILINMAGLWLANYFVQRMTFSDEGPLTLLLLAVLFSLINAFIRPIIRFLTCPLTLLTLGLFTFVINALMLLILGMTPWLTFEGDFWQRFLAAFVASIIISIVSTVANWLLPDRD